ncbi:Iwr1 domain-containing protein [Trichophyton interdigitale]|nr:Iwr1 domain-containing protein [Trichophyton interdigitale]KAG5218106.1 Iwr1 domain-containing protein [Trichophyton interdigitale]KAG8206536.1 Iwr1 domain-containing protein [Trichophyton interdigitale]
MSLPPERIRIKRRREDEPVETLYIQSDIHQPKRRFTDYVFQRVVLHIDNENSQDGPKGGPAPESQAKGRTQGNRAVTVSHHTTGSSGTAVNRSGIPIITTPSMRSDGAKSKQKQPIATDRDEHDSTDIESARSDSPSLSTLSSVPKVVSAVKRPATAQPSGSSVRRFHLEAPRNTENPDDALDVLHRVHGGIQRKRPRKISSYRPVVVENIAVANKTALDKASISAKGRRAEFQGGPGETENATIEKRHVLYGNHEDSSKSSQSYQLDKETRKGESVLEDPSTWDLDSDNLANELARIALEMTNSVEPSAEARSTTKATTSRATLQKRPLKYKPRLPKTPRTGHQSNEQGKASISATSRADGSIKSSMELNNKDTGTNSKLDCHHVPDTSENLITSAQDEDSDSGYVFDEFIRRPVHDVIADPSVSYFQDGKWIEGREFPKDVGVVVITQGDSHFWDAIAEDDDEKDWDTEDEDSNAEDNPANEYPDEDLDFDDEYCDNNAIYRRFRVNASDEEEYDTLDYDTYSYRTYPCNMLSDSDSDP